MMYGRRLESVVSPILMLGALLILFALAITPACANVWLDEDFDDSLAFNAFSLDPFPGSQPTSASLTMAQAQGRVVNDKAFSGSYAYRLAPGQRLVVNAGDYEQALNGPFQYYQFALNVPDAPTQAGVIGSYHWNWGETPEGPATQSLYVKWQWNGSLVEIIAGQDRPTSVSKTIALIENLDEWRFITIQMQKNAESETDARTGQTLTPGVRFYCSGADPVMEIPLASVQASQDWSFRSTGGHFLLDSLYWEGGMTVQDEASRALQPFDRSAVNAGPREIPLDYPVSVVSVQADPLFDPMLMPRAEGWLGSDAAWSIPLDENRILWLFGDTLLGKTNGNRRGLDHFINNTIAIQDTSEGLPGSVEYYWQGDAANPHAFFMPENGEGYLWPGIGTMLDGELFLFLYTVAPGGNVGFQLGKTVMVRVENPLDPPGQWRQISRVLPFGSSTQGFNSALHREGKYLYLMGYDDEIENTSGRQAVLARACVESLVAGDYDQAFEFWVQNESGLEWGDTPENLVPLFTPGVTETGIQHFPEWGLYFCTTYPIFNGDIQITTAPELTGPWRKPVTIYRIPEHHEGNYLSYAVKAHPELSTRLGEVILTYVVNGAWVLEPVLENINVYYPRFLRLQFDIKNKSVVPHELWASYAASDFPR